MAIQIYGLYKGMASPIAGVALINSLLFGVHGWFMHQIAAPPSTRYAGNWDCITQMYRAGGGLRAFYVGMLPTLWRDTPSYGAYFASYELFAGLLTPPTQPLDEPSAGLLIAGGLAGIVSWISTYPFDVIKTRMQSDLLGARSSMVKTAIDIYRADGLRPFFSGLGATCVRAFPTNAATFYGVSCMRAVLEKHNRAKAIDPAF
ncbi:hypothetical protein HDU83_005518 [Entophlyctis luteolus]|nr:hypothetical protein HDU83_005518 [Entophlyctis luteolus]